MTTKILAPHYLRIEREIAAPVDTVWRALTDTHELRAWWGMPVCEHEPDVGGGFELRYIGRDRTDKFRYTTWDHQWRVGGLWSYTWLPGVVNEMLVMTPVDKCVRVGLEHTGFESFGPETRKLFGYFKIESGARLRRLQDWCERRIPATMAQMPVV